MLVVVAPAISPHHAQALRPAPAASMREPPLSTGDAAPSSVRNSKPTRHTSIRTRLAQRIAQVYVGVPECGCWHLHPGLAIPLDRPVADGGGAPV